MTHPPFAVILGSRFGIRSRPGTEAGDEGIPGGASTGDRSNVATACRCHGRTFDHEATDARHRTVLPRPLGHGVSESGNAGRAEGAQGRELLRISKARRTSVREAHPMSWSSDRGVEGVSRNTDELASSEVGTSV